MKMFFQKRKRNMPGDIVEDGMIGVGQRHIIVTLFDMVEFGRNRPLFDNMCVCVSPYCSEDEKSEE